MRLLVENIAKIVGVDRSGRLRAAGAEMDRAETINDGWILAEGGDAPPVGQNQRIPETMSGFSVSSRFP